ncbi:MAG: phosphate acetyltransferase, partial [Aliifodinibius sp.]|nr:phosphate acetyltransferase [Fodinibius sp.]NIV15221.1 phosphate acetyltransferase [Fodinibius sp.]NIY29079.1 phosphate acetyltransferase [Fodinibius sp.]
MDVKIIQQIRDRASKQNKTIVFPEARDQRVLKAAAYLVKKNICDIRLLGNKQEILSSVNEKEEESVAELSSYFVDGGESREVLAEHLYERRKHKGISREEAIAKLEDPLYLGALMVATGAADGCV